jgi:plastocyanin
MKRICTLGAVLVAVAALAGNAASATPKLTATVADPVVITLKQGAAKVTKLKAGKYTIVVQDKSAAHNFHLTGPGFNKATSVSGKATTTWTVNLKKGKWTYVCDPHKSFMKGSFTVS